MLNKLVDFNFITVADSYKCAHLRHLKPGTLKSHSNIVARKPFVDEEHGIEIEEIVVLGPQVVAKILASVRITNEMIDEAEVEITEQGYDFPRSEWEAIRDLWYLPLEVRAVPEGTVLPVGLPLMTVENTDDRFPWLPSYVETWVQDIVWTMSTIATKVRFLRAQVDEFCKTTGVPAENAEYMIHNFGDRGAGGRDRAIMAGIAHAVFFSGSDCLDANRHIKAVYNTTKPILSSVDANEHSVVCSCSDCENRDDRAAFEMSLEALDRSVERASRGVGIPLISALIDTFDDERYVKEFVIPSYDRITEIGGRYVCRPDSGDAVAKPVEVVNWLLEGLPEVSSKTAAGFFALPGNIGVIQGDGLKLWDFARIFKLAVANNQAASNFAFGFGGGLTNGSTRDDFSFSMKATAIQEADGTWRDLQKLPKTDMSKASLKGRVTVCLSGERFLSVETIERAETDEAVVDLMETIYKDCNAKTTTFDKVRERARS